MTVLITGASSGFGEEMAREFVLNGHKVIILARRKSRLETLHKELENININSSFIMNMDVANIKENDIKNLPESFKNIDVLINNAGFALGLESADKANLNDWNMMVDINIKALINITRIILPIMVENNRGHIINIGSVAGEYPYPGGNVYGASKAFVKQFSLNLRADLLGKNIRVSNVAPGLAKSEFSLTRFKGDAKRADEVYSGVDPLVPKDIARVIYFIASLPPHVNVNNIEIMPTMQAFAPLAVFRE